jgi:hypothetical protein
MFHVSTLLPHSSSDPQQVGASLGCGGCSDSRAYRGCQLTISLPPSVLFSSPLLLAGTQTAHWK